MATIDAKLHTFSIQLCSLELKLATETKECKVAIVFDLSKSFYDATNSIFTSTDGQQKAYNYNHKH